MSGSGRDRNSSVGSGPAVRRRTVLGGLTAGVVLTTAGCLGTSEDEDGGTENASLRDNPGEGGQNGTDSGNTSGATSTEPLVYLQSGHSLYALTGHEGEERWSHTYGYPFVLPYPVIVDGELYYCMHDGEDASAVVSISAATGEEQWRFDTSTEEITTSPCVTRDRVYAGTSMGTIYTIDRATGEGEQLTSTSGWAKAAPAVANDRLWISFGSEIAAFDTETGEEQWRVGPSGFTGFGTPQIVDGTLYATSGGVALAADPNSGEILWQRQVPESATLGNVIVSEGALYFGDLVNSRLHALDAAGGDVLWTFSELPESISGAPTIAAGTVYACVEGSTDDAVAAVYAIDAASGRSTWRHQFDEDTIGNTPTVYDGVVYVHGPGNTLYAFDADEGDVLWTRDPSRLIGTSGWSPVVAADPEDGSGAGSRSRLGTHGTNIDY